MLRNINKLFPSLVPKNMCKLYISTLPKEQKIKIDKYNVNYIIVGTGPHHVLCMPGTFGTFSTHFKHQLEGFDLDKFTLVAWDPPGFGKSRPPIRDFPVDMFEKDAENAHELMTKLNIPKYSIIGWSAGGISSLIIAAKQPDAIRKTVVWGARSFVYSHEVDFLKTVRDAKTWPLPVYKSVTGVYGEELTAQYGRGWVDCLCEIFETRGGNICDEILKDITCPTLLLHGEEDILVDKRHPEHLLKNIKNSRLQYYKKAGHTMPFWIAGKLNDDIQDFLLQP